MWYTIVITLVVDIGGLLLIYVLLRDRVRRATTADSQIADIREEVSRLLVELNQTTDRNIALIEDRIARLNGELAAADKKIGLLSREIEKHDMGTRIYTRLAEGRASASPRIEGRPASAAVPPARARPAAHRGAQPEGPEAAAAASARSTAAPNPRGSARQNLADPAAPSLAVELSDAASESAEEPDIHERVMMLHRAGFAPSLIASRVGVPLGEVELIISLEQRKDRRGPG